jgi:hypothetical protein
MTVSSPLATGQTRGQQLANLASILANLWTNAVAYIALLAGAGLSMAGNVADVYRTRGGLTDQLDIVIAVAMPGLVILAVHMFVSPRWDGLNWPMQAMRWAGCLAIGGMAMVVSWFHLHDLLVARDQPDVATILEPLALDMMAIMATALLLAGRRAIGQVEAGQDAGQDVGQLQEWVSGLEKQVAKLAIGHDQLNPGRDLPGLIGRDQPARPRRDTGQANGGHWDGSVASEQGTAEAEPTSLADEAAAYLARESAKRSASAPAKPPPPEVAGLVANMLKRGAAMKAIDQEIADAYKVSTRVARRWRSQLREAINGGQDPMHDPGQ